MFGHQDDKSPQDTSAVSDESSNEAIDAEDKPSGEPAVQSSTTEPVSIVESDSAAAAPELVVTATATPAADDQSLQQPDTLLPSDKEQIKDMISPAGGFPKRPSFQSPLGTHDPVGSPISLDDNTDAATHELIDIRQQALGELAPIIDQLDLPPEEKFHTIMMMIQASDDQTMVKPAYAAAHSIEDEKVRAQALLDIVNEVNYFTQPPEAAI
jgi:hypothetical protein